MRSMSSAREDKSDFHRKFDKGARRAMSNVGTAFRESFISMLPGGNYINYVINGLEIQAEQNKVQEQYKQQEAKLAASASIPELNKDGDRREVHRCNVSCEAKMSLLRLASRYGIYLQEGALKSDLASIKQMIIARARHNINGFISIARENPGLGLDRAIQTFANQFEDNRIRELVGHDVQIGSIYLQGNDKLSLNA